MKVRYPIAPGHWGVAHRSVLAHEETKPVFKGSYGVYHWALGGYWFQTEVYDEG
jgi:hypothetical protein